MSKNLNGDHDRRSCFSGAEKNNKHIFAIICESLLTNSGASSIFKAAGKVAKFGSRLK
jgi:hypothetical protein